MANRLPVSCIITASPLPFGRSQRQLRGLTTGLRVGIILFLPAVAFSMTASVLVRPTRFRRGNHREADARCSPRSASLRPDVLRGATHISLGAWTRRLDRPIPPCRSNRQIPFSSTSWPLPFTRPPASCWPGRLNGARPEVYRWSRSASLSGRAPAHHMCSLPTSFSLAGTPRRPSLHLRSRVVMSFRSYGSRCAATGPVSPWPCVPTCASR